MLSGFQTHFLRYCWIWWFIWNFAGLLYFRWFVTISLFSWLWLNDQFGYIELWIWHFCFIACHLIFCENNLRRRCVRCNNGYCRTSRIGPPIPWFCAHWCVTDQFAKPSSFIGWFRHLSSLWHLLIDKNTFSRFCISKSWLAQILC